jgi:hypothetical protein
MGRARNALRTLFAKAKRPGWLLLALGGLWKLADQLGTVEFVITKAVAVWSLLVVTRPNLSRTTEWLLSMATANNAQWVLMFGGLVWLFVVVYREQHSPVINKPTEDPTETALPNQERRRLVRGLLHRSYQHGDAIGGDAPDDLMRKWAGDTKRLIRESLGDAEADLFVSNWEWDAIGTNAEWMNRRQTALYNLMKRVPFMKVRPDFDLDDWIARAERGD